MQNGPKVGEKGDLEVLNPGIQKVEKKVTKGDQKCSKPTRELKLTQLYHIYAVTIKPPQMYGLRIFTEHRTPFSWNVDSVETALTNSFDEITGNTLGEKDKAFCRMFTRDIYIGVDESLKELTCHISYIL